MSKPKIIILHDYFLYKGGGERLVISLAKGLNCPIVTAFTAQDAFDPRDHGIETIDLFKETIFSHIPGFRYAQVQLAFLFKTRKILKNYDIVIHSADTLTALLSAQDKVNIAYLHTPPRHLYDRYEDTVKSYRLLKKLIFIPFAAFNRWKFSTLSKRFNLILTNSKNVQERIKKYLHLNSTVVYPPCDTLPFKNLGYGDYFFSWARLYPIKRVDKIVEAFQKMPDKKLVIASGGSELEKIKTMAQNYPNIQVVGWITDDQLLDLLGKCLASIYIPIREDFGMSPVESMTAGKPVIGVAEGGMLEVIEDSKNGMLLPPNFTTQDIIIAVQKMTLEKAKSMEQSCYKTAARFTEEKFVTGIKKEMNKISNFVE